MARQKLIMGSTMLIELVGLRNRLTGLYPTNAVVDADLITEAGVPVAGGSNLTVTYDEDAGTGSRTAYYGAIPSSVSLTEGDEYRVQVTAIVDGVTRVFDIPCIAALR